MRNLKVMDTDYVDGENSEIVVELLLGDGNNLIKECLRSLQSC